MHYVKKHYYFCTNVFFFACWTILFEYRKKNLNFKKKHYVCWNTFPLTKAVKKFKKCCLIHLQVWVSTLTYANIFVVRFTLIRLRTLFTSTSFLLTASNLLQFLVRKTASVSNSKNTASLQKYDLARCQERAFMSPIKITARDFILHELAYFCVFFGF
jgi:hypothetical protein